MKFVPFRFGCNGLPGVTDFFAAVVHTPPLLDVFSKSFRAAQGNNRRRRADVALDEKKIHQAPKKHDADADRSLNKHAVEHIW